MCFWRPRWLLPGDRSGPGHSIIRVHSISQSFAKAERRLHEYMASEAGKVHVGFGNGNTPQWAIVAPLAGHFVNGLFIRHDGWHHGWHRNTGGDGPVGGTGLIRSAERKEGRVCFQSGGPYQGTADTPVTPNPCPQHTKPPAQAMAGKAVAVGGRFGRGYNPAFGASFMRLLGKALTFDDVLLVPAYSRILPKDTSLATKLSRNIELNLPLVSAAMDTVTEARLAIAIAQEGGVGIVHKNLTPQAQAAQVAKVKRYESGVLRDPVVITPGHTVLQVLQLSEQLGISG